MSDRTTLLAAFHDQADPSDVDFIHPATHRDFINSAILPEDLVGTGSNPLTVPAVIAPVGYTETGLEPEGSMYYDLANHCLKVMTNTGWKIVTLATPPPPGNIFTGSNDLYRDDSFMPTGAAPWTMAVKFNTALSGVQQSLMAFGCSDPVTNYQAALIYLNSDDTLHWTDFAEDAVSPSFTVPGANHSAVCRFDGTNLYLYLDALTPASITPSLNIVSQKLIIGYNMYVNFFTGTMWDAAVWNSDIGDTAAAAIAAGGSPSGYTPTAYWPLSADILDHGPLYPSGYDLTAGP